VGEGKKRRRLRIQWCVYELETLPLNERYGGVLGLSLEGCFTGTKVKAQRWIRESGHPNCDYVILPVYQVEEV